MKNTVVLDSMPDIFWEKTRQSGWDKYIKPASKSVIADAEIAIIRTRTKFGGQLFSKMPRLSLIIRAGSGYDNIDLQEAKKRQVRVCTTPEANKTAAYEHTLSLILALLKGHQIGKEAILHNKWKQTCSKNWEISDLQALIVGAGRIGSLIADTLLDWGAVVKIVDPYLSDVFVKQKRYKITNYQDGLKWCNLVTFHCPLSWETRDYFSLNSLDLLSQPIWIVNTARGFIVNELALKTGLERNKIRGVALDVFSREPWTHQDFTPFNNVYLTPHTGAYTDKAEKRLVSEIMKTWDDFCYKKILRNEVNYRFYNDKIER